MDSVLQFIKSTLQDQPERAWWSGCSLFLLLALLYSQHTLHYWRLNYARLEASKGPATPVQLSKEVQLLQEYNQGIKKLLDNYGGDVDFDELLKQHLSGLKELLLITQPKPAPVPAPAPPKPTEPLEVQLLREYHEGLTKFMDQIQDRDAEDNPVEVDFPQVIEAFNKGLEKFLSLKNQELCLNTVASQSACKD